MTRRERLGFGAFLLIGLLYLLAFGGVPRSTLPAIALGVGATGLLFWLWQRR